MATRAAMPLSSADNDYTSATYVTSLRGETRRILKEPVAANYYDGGIDQAIRDEYASLWSELSRVDSRRRTSTPTSMTYTAASIRVTLPTAILNRPIITVHDITGSSDYPIPLEYVQWDDLFDRAGNYLNIAILNQFTSARRKYSLLNNQIALYPAPGGALTLSIVYLPSVDDLATVAHELEVEHEPVIYWGAALRCMKPDAEETPSIQATYDRYRADLMRSVKRWVRSRPLSIRHHRRYF